MKTKIFLLIIGIILGYLIGNFLPPVNLFQFLEEEKKESIIGNCELRVAIFSEDMPIKDLEVDIAKQPGPPPEGGVFYTDDNGIATFNLKPGKYFLYFNSSNFPQNLEYPEPQEVLVEEGKINKITVEILPAG